MLQSLQDLNNIVVESDPAISTEVGSNGSNDGLIIGVAVGVVGGIVLIALVVAIMVRSKSEPMNKPVRHSPPPPLPAHHPLAQ